MSARKRPKTLNLGGKSPRTDSESLPSSLNSQDTGIFGSEGESQEEERDDHANIITQNYVQLVENLQPQLFLHLLPRALFSSIDDDMRKKDKTRTLLDMLKRSPRKYFNSFCEAIAGLHPSLFELLTKRKPTRQESNVYLKPFCDKLQEGILCTGSKTDNAVDPRIDLDKQYVSPKLIVVTNKGQPLYTNQPVTEDDMLLSEGITLVTGRAGVGKSTLIQHLNRQWARKRWASNYLAMFLLNLRNIAHLQRDMTVAQLLGMYAEYVPETPDAIQPTAEWLENNQEKILIFSPGAKLENGGLPYTESPLSFDGFN